MTANATLMPSLPSAGVSPEPESTSVGDHGEEAAEAEGGDPDGERARKKRRVSDDVNDEYLETEEEVPAEDLEEFADRMSSPQINAERGSTIWRMYWREHAEERLKWYNPDAYAEYERKKADRTRDADSARAHAGKPREVEESV